MIDEDDDLLSPQGLTKALASIFAATLSPMASPPCRSSEVSLTVAWRSRKGVKKKRCAK
jgi:hypothetical protein